MELFADPPFLMQIVGWLGIILVLFWIFGALATGIQRTMYGLRDDENLPSPELRRALREHKRREHRSDS